MGYQTGAFEPVTSFQSFAGAEPRGAQHCILLLDDDKEFRSTITSFLQRSGFATLTGSGMQDLARHLATGPVDLVILGTRLETEDGLALLRYVRSRSAIPVIIAGEGRDAVDRVVALELGADDYLTKPLSPHELAARARAVLRRTNSGSRERSESASEYRFAGWRLDRKSRHLFDPEGSPVPLTKREYGLLLAFLDAPGRPLSRAHLLHATRVHEDAFDRSIDVQVLRLRRKLEADPATPSIIRTERGIGYVFALPVEPL